MKNLDLNAYGVQEMNHQEMVETDGGVLGLLAAVGWLLIGVCVAEMLDRDAPSDMAEGYNDARSKK